MIVALSAIAVSCEKEEINRHPSDKGTLTSNIADNDCNMTVMAFKSAATTIPKYEYIEVIGHSVLEKTTDYNYFAITIYASSITAKTYNVPDYSSGYTYDNTTGFATGYFFTGTSNTVTNWYYSQYIHGATGTVTISSITDSTVYGSYDMTLVNWKDSTKTLKFNGNFQTSLTSYEN